MDNRKLTVKIRGTEVLPVRAIPYVVRPRLLDRRDVARCFAGHDPRPWKKWTLKAYSLSPSNDYDWFEVPRIHWGVVESRFDRISLGLNFLNPNSDKVLRLYTVATALPAHWFVRLNEFEAQLRTELEENLLTEAERGRLELNLSPPLDFDTFATIMQGLAVFIEKSLVYKNETGPESASTSRSERTESEQVAPNAPHIIPGTAEADPSVSQHSEALASLFDPVRRQTLEKMYPEEQWEEWISHASSNGLCDARVSHGKYNPYKVGIWLVERGKKGWSIGRVYRVLANNLPARSRDERHLLIPDSDYF